MKLGKLTTLIEELISSNKFGSFIIYTDLEPDDLLALAILFAHLSKYSQIDLRIVVGGGRISKVIMMRNMMRYFKLTNFVVCEGDRSDAEYPEQLLRVFGEFYLRPGADIFHPIDESRTNIIMALKPVLEVLRLDDAICTNSILFAYGSFNFRSIGQTNQTLLQNKLSKFQHVMLFERILSITDNNDDSMSYYNYISSPIYRRLLRLMEEGNPLWGGIVESSQIWNQHITKKQLYKVMKSVKSILQHHQTEPIFGYYTGEEPLRVYRKIQTLMNATEERHPQIISQLQNLYTITATMLRIHFGKTYDPEIDTITPIDKLMLDLEHSIRIIEVNIHSQFMQMALADQALVSASLSGLNTIDCNITFDPETQRTVPVEGNKVELFKCTFQVINTAIFNNLDSTITMMNHKS